MERGVGKGRMCLESRRRISIRMSRDQATGHQEHSLNLKLLCEMMLCPKHYSSNVGPNSKLLPYTFVLYLVMFVSASPP